MAMQNFEPTHTIRIRLRFAAGFPEYPTSMGIEVSEWVEDPSRNDFWAQYRGLGGIVYQPLTFPPTSEVRS